MLRHTSAISHHSRVIRVKTNSGFYRLTVDPSHLAVLFWSEKSTNPFADNGLFVSPLGVDLFICYSAGECLQHSHFIANHDAEPHEYRETVGDGTGR
jgi:hypothetical protein